MGRLMLCVWWVLLGVAAVAGAEPAPSEREVLTVRVYDYSETEPAVLAQAQKQTSQAFSAIGVQIVWKEAVRPKRIDAGLEFWPGDGQAFITMTIQNREMAARHRVGRDVAGYAVIEPSSTGRVAFLIADRIVQTARAGHAAPARVFGLVMTHELVHLLLGDRSHSSFGVMRPDWAAADFRQNVGKFNARQGAALRSAVSRLTMSQQVAD